MFIFLSDSGDSCSFYYEEHEWNFRIFPLTKKNHGTISVGSAI